MHEFRTLATVAIIAASLIWHIVHWRKTGPFGFIGTLAFASSSAALLLPSEVYFIFSLGNEKPPIFYVIILFFVGLTTIALTIRGVYIKKRPPVEIIDMFVEESSARREIAFGKLLEYEGYEEEE